MSKKNELRILVKAAECLCDMSYKVLVEHAYEHSDYGEEKTYFTQMADLQKAAQRIVNRMEIITNDNLVATQKLESAEIKFNKTFKAAYKQAVTERPF
tara:strand:- start:14302 stop:14595 length:294 start_codon:yes stop_codon:yes gene_type:complete